MNKEQKEILVNLTKQLDDLKKYPLLSMEQNKNEFEFITNEFNKNNIPFKIDWEDFKKDLKINNDVELENDENDDDYDNSYDYDYDNSYDEDYDNSYDEDEIENDR